MKNEYYHEGELSFIELGNGTYAATIARQHFDLIAGVESKWSVMWNGYTNYAITTRINQDTGKHENIYMHRLICGLQQGDERVVDHLDFCGLNNVVSNLRVVSKSANSSRRQSYIERDLPPHVYACRNGYTFQMFRECKRIQKYSTSLDEILRIRQDFYQLYNVQMP